MQLTNPGRAFRKSFPINLVLSTVLCAAELAVACPSDLPVGPPSNLTHARVARAQATDELPAGTKVFTLSHSTSADLICKYSTEPEQTYEQKSGIFTQVALGDYHAQVSGLEDGRRYYFYIMCRDAGGTGDLYDKVQSVFVQNAPDTEMNVDTEYQLGVLVLRMMPIDASGNVVDPNAQPQSSSLEDIRSSMRRQQITAKAALEDASRFHGYKDPLAKPSIRYSIVEEIESIAAIPYVPSPRPNFFSEQYIDYRQLMNSVSICDYVDYANVREVWLFKASARPGFRHDESKMAGPYGDISNSWRINEMPVCQHSYRVYTHDYERDDLFLHVWGHQLEAELDALDYSLAEQFLSPCDDPTGYSCYPLANKKAKKFARCGNIHNAPNAHNEYDITNPVEISSDCMDWQPDQIGPLSSVSCSLWGCAGDYSIESNATVNYTKWLLQNMPGRGNKISMPSRGAKLRNWWDVHGDFDRVIGNYELLSFGGEDREPQGSRMLNSKLKPRKSIVRRNKSLTLLQLEPLLSSKRRDFNLKHTQYEIEIRKPKDKRFKQQIKTTSRNFAIYNLKKGTYEVSYRALDWTTLIKTFSSDKVRFTVK